MKRRPNTISGSLPGGEEAQRARPRYDMDSNVRHPNHARDPNRSPDQLDARACLAWPLRLFAPLEWLALERVVELDLLLEDDVDAACEFLLDEGPRDGRVLLPCLALIEALVVGTGHDAAVGEELTDRWKALDPVDLEIVGEGGDLSDAGDPEQALNVGFGDQARLELLLDPPDLVCEQFDLLLVQGRRKGGLIGERCRIGYVELPSNRWMEFFALTRLSTNWSRVRSRSRRGLSSELTIWARGIRSTRCN